ncbi:MAG: class I SAM-dependent methyltransferase [Candidatus Kariarchaeaceae archaeon]|jgi:ubiquinone/menaquinone biosynthesis C-methylase UbiE
MDTSKIFAGTAKYYRRYREYCPKEVVQILVEQVGLDKTQRLLDLGCGTGQIAIPLSEYVREVIALDTNEEMVEQGKAETRVRDVRNVQFLRGEAENISGILGKFELVTFGSSFHWMDQEKVMRNLPQILTTSGVIAIIGSKSTWTSSSDWEVELRSALRIFSPMEGLAILPEKW